MPPQMDADSCKTEGNAAMAEQDYVNAMKWYSQAIALSPRDGALFSNRSFAFLRLGLTSRALADADEAVRRRPEWNKGHFRRAECLKQAGLHAEAHAAYATAARLDPADAHVQKACVEAQARHASQMLSAMQVTLQRESIERSKLAASLSASQRQLETAQAALQSKELTIAKMRSRIGSSSTTGALAQDMARLGYTLGLKST